MTNKMNSERKTAIIVGVLYIIGTVSGIIWKVLAGSIPNDLNLLTKVTANENQIIIGALSCCLWVWHLLWFRL